ncbi:MAG: nucleotide-binding protein [Flavobacterium sp.]|jgi:predicted nucleotide-binding protein|nr:nucleotide-binding protein [Flavobacterium sp.]
MSTESELKPLFANLKRLKIGNYLCSNDFKLYALENDFDDIWNECKGEVIDNHKNFFPRRLDTEDYEEALGLLIGNWYSNHYGSFEEFFLKLLLSFAKWHPTKLDFNKVVLNMVQLDFDKDSLSSFKRDIKKISEKKPEKLNTSIPSNENREREVLNKKVFIVHGHDDKARLELFNIVKDDLKLEPIVLQEQPNVSVETILSKFERLAKDCSSALVLFTPDDSANGNLRARQNVILELGYFLGKFHNADSKRIAIIKNGNVEIPSDISGVIYLEYSKNIKEIYYDLKKQFDTWGIK